MIIERMPVKRMEFSQRPAISKLVLGINLILSFVGIYGSFQVVSGLFGIEADSSHSLMLWQGVREHGLPWIKDWLFTQDNWLFSLVPFHFIGFSIFGAEAWIVLLFGWVIFVLSALLSGAIAWRVGARNGALFVVVALLNFGLYAHQNGFVSYSTSHNITNLFGLAALLVLLAWSTKPSNGLLGLLLVLLCAGALSDPWMIAAYNLPIFLAGLFYLAKPTGVINRGQSLKLLALSSISIFAVKTRLFGLLSFLPGMQFLPGDWQTIKTNIVYLVKDLGGLLNIIPFSGSSNGFLPGLLTIIALALVLLYGAVVFVRSGPRLSEVTMSYFLVASLSTGGIIAAFVISGIEAKDYSARFLINSAYLIVITIGIFAGFCWERLAAAAKYALCTVFVLFLSSSFISNAGLISNGDFRFRDTGVSRTVSFLKDHGLTYGYGPYWGSNANAVTATSDAQVRIRPVVFDKNSGMMIVGNRPETSRRWYKAEDIPDGVKEFFVMVKPDGEECPEPDVCIKGLVKQFGEPVRTLKHEGASILVWDHRLLGREMPPLEVEMDKTYVFNQSGEYPNGDGWSQPETAGTWTDGDAADLRLVLRGYEGGDVDMTVDAHAFLFGRHETLNVEVAANGQSIGQIKYRLPDNGGPRGIRIPASVLESGHGRLRLEFFIDAPRSPLELGASGDRRNLGIMLASITLKSLGPDRP